MVLVDLDLVDIQICGPASICRAVRRPCGGRSRSLDLVDLDLVEIQA